jgi:hypothetical protein
MQGKSCFNFKTPDAELFEELASVTAHSIAGMRQAGFIVNRETQHENTRARRRALILLLMSLPA